MKAIMNAGVKYLIVLLLVSVILLSWAAGNAAADNNDDGQPETSGAQSKSMLDFIRAGGVVGYVIIALSFVGIGFAIDAFINIQSKKLIPLGLAQEFEQLAAHGKFSEIKTLCQANETMFGRIVGAALSQGQMGIEAVKESMQESGTREVTRLRQRVGYIGFIASVAPMLGLLGTLTGMIGSFDVLGMEKGAARPDQLAVGISEALITTCMGLVVAVPLMFFYSILRDRITRIGQQASGQCDRLLRCMSVAIVARETTRNASRADPGGDKHNA